MIKKVKTIIDSPDSYSRVNYLSLKGSNREIGREIGDLAKRDHDIVPRESKSELITRTQINYMKENYPIYYNRMEGYASSFGLKLDNYSYDFSIFGRALGETACSAVYYPPESTEDETAVLSRNLDFVLYDDEAAPFKQVYIMELHPDEGYSSISVLTMEVFGQGLEGMNSKGLTVVHLADGESAELYPEGGRDEAGVGFNEFLIIQYLLDTCANIDEAKEALLKAKHYYHCVPVHLLICDSSGSSFIWEFHEHRNKEYIVDGSDKPQIITNFLLSKFGECADKLPVKDDNPCCAFNRYRALNEAIKERGDIFSLNDIKDINSRVYFKGVLDFSSKEEQARTLMHTIYFPKNRELFISFYLNESNGNQSRSEFIKFTL